MREDETFISERLDKDILDYGVMMYENFVGTGYAKGLSVEQWEDGVTGTDISDLVHELFNTDYFIIGRKEAARWLGENIFDVIWVIQDYEDTQFGERYTDLSEPERVANMYVYIRGERILPTIIEQGNKSENKRVFIDKGLGVKYE
tara:strand:+ start:274 stop:711 length:438 start_codon:yes stop_codon:yes gene_type:complete